jgi:hypothetical protein
VKKLYQQELNLPGAFIHFNQDHRVQFPGRQAFFQKAASAGQRFPVLRRVCSRAECLEH